LDRRLVLRGANLLLADLIAIGIAIMTAFALRFDATDVLARIAVYMPMPLLPLVVRPFVNLAFGLYRRDWRFASSRELVGIALAAVVGSLITLAIFLVLAVADAPGTPGMPRSFFALEGLVSLVLMGGLRFAPRFRHDQAARARAAGPESGVRTLIYGAGEAGALVARLISRDRGQRIRIVGYLDDDRRRHKQVMLGNKILGGLDDLAEIVELTAAQQLLVAIPSAPGSVIRRIVDAGLKLDIQVRTVPPLIEFLSGDVALSHIRKVRVEDLLRRAPIDIDLDAMAAYLNGQSVLITGGGGSIGSELARQVLALGPRRLTIVDHHEGALWAIERELARIERGRERSVVDAVLGDIRSAPAMAGIVAAAQPDVVFHAAALKHVPIVELQPSESILTNVVGTRHVLEACERFGVPRFVLISTDKAVMPVGAMGASKRLAENLTVAAARRTGRNYVAVRFGNVLGSHGSVVQIFEQQIAAGEPLTITHPDATRYFMTTQEAVSLILEAGGSAVSGDVYVLDMGEPIRIMDLAEDLIRLSGRSRESMQVNFTGLRPGERLHETLVYDHESTEPTLNPGILRARSSVPESSLGDLEELIEQLEAAAERYDDRTVRQLLRDGRLLSEALADEAMTRQRAH
jgi:FlaA1/EpsC-like NDP-sugar epimerase